MFLFEYRGLKGTFYIQPDQGGDYDLSYDPDGNPVSKNFDLLLEYGDAAADRLAERKKIHGATTMPDAAVAGGAIRPTNPPPASSTQQTELCPECGAGTTWKSIKKKDGSMGRVLECANPEHTDFRSGRTFAHTVRWA